MLTQLKTNLYVALFSALFAALGVFGYFHFHDNKALNMTMAQLSVLKYQETELNAKLAISNSTIENDKTKEKILQDKLILSNANLAKANVLIASIHNTEVIPTLHESPEAIAKIKDLYQDGSTTYQGVRFQILDTTTYTMLSDAENWKINGPILTDSVGKYKIGWDVANASNEDLKQLVLQDQVTINDHQIKEVVLSNLNNTKDKQLVNVNQMLKIEGNNVKIKAVEGFLSGIFLYYLRDKIRK